MRQNERFYMVAPEIVFEDGGGDGWYFSELIDSGVRQNNWSRAELFTELFPNTSVAATFYAADSKQTDGLFISEILDDGELLPEEKTELLKSCAKNVFVNTRDIMFRDLRGRYIWFSIRCRGNGKDTPCVSAVKITRDRFDWTAFLPEIYSGEDGDFTRRFLSIFQRIYERLNEKIRDLPLKFDIRKTDRDMLGTMAHWIGLRCADSFDDERLRLLLTTASGLRSRIGTADMLEDIVGLYTGVRPIILEGCDAADEAQAISAWETGRCPRSAFSFAVLLPNYAVGAENEHKTLLKLINEYKPAHMSFRLIFTDRPWNIPKTDENSVYLNDRTALTK